MMVCNALGTTDPDAVTESINEQRIAATTLGQHFMSELHERHPTVQAELKKRSRVHPQMIHVPCADSY